MNNNLTITTKADYLVNYYNQLILADTSSNNITIYLPDITQFNELTQGTELSFIIKKISANNTVTVLAQNSGQSVESNTLSSNNEVKIYKYSYDGVWRLVSNAGSGEVINPMTTEGDMIYEDNTLSPARLGIGVETQVLTVSGGIPAWQPIPILGTLVYYFTPTVSDVVADKKQIVSPYTPITTTSFAGVVNNQLLVTYITEPNNPNRLFIPSGQYSCHIHAAKTAGTKTTQLYAEVWETTALGVDIAKIATLGNSTVLTGINAEYFIAESAPIYNLSSLTSRIATKIYASITGGGSAPTIQIYVGDASDSRTNLPATSIDINSYVPYTGATTNVNLGTNSLSASTLKVTSVAGYKSSDNSSGATGSFTTTDGKTVTVKDGIITSIV